MLRKLQLSFLAQAQNKHFDLLFFLLQEVQRSLHLFVTACMYLGRREHPFFLPTTTSKLLCPVISLITHRDGVDSIRYPLSLPRRPASNIKSKLTLFESDLLLPCMDMKRSTVSSCHLYGTPRADSTPISLQRQVTIR